MIDLSASDGFASINLGGGVVTHKGYVGRTIDMQLNHVDPSELPTAKISVGHLVKEKGTTDWPTPDPWSK